MDVIVESDRRGFIKQLSTRCVRYTDLDDTHRKAGLLGQLLSNVPRWLRRLRECILQDLQLFGFDGGAGAAPFGAGPAFVRRFRFGGVVTSALAFSVPINRAYKQNQNNHIKETGTFFLSDQLETRLKNEMTSEGVETDIYLPNRCHPCRRWWSRVSKAAEF
jgi:hypothetical protein